MKKSAAPPADLNGEEANVGVKQVASETPAFAGFALKKTARPADFDGSVPNTGVKEVEHLQAPTVTLKSAEGGVRE